jgi:hypothetical protein
VCVWWLCVQCLGFPGCSPKPCPAMPDPLPFGEGPCKRHAMAHIRWHTVLCLAGLACDYSSVSSGALGAVGRYRSSVLMKYAVIPRGIALRR